MILKNRALDADNYTGERNSLSITKRRERKTMENVAIQIAEAERDLRAEAEKLSLSEVKAFTEKLTQVERMEIARHLEGQARYMVRLATYIEARAGYGGSDNGHDLAVKAQNDKEFAVAKALGYTSPKRDIRF